MNFVTLVCLICTCYVRYLLSKLLKIMSFTKRIHNPFFKSNKSPYFAGEF